MYSGHLFFNRLTSNPNAPLGKRSCATYLLPADPDPMAPTTTPHHTVVEENIILNPTLHSSTSLNGFTTYKSRSKRNLAPHPDVDKKHLRKKQKKKRRITDINRKLTPNRYYWLQHRDERGGLRSKAPRRNPKIKTRNGHTAPNHAIQLLENKKHWREVVPNGRETQRAGRKAKSQ